MEDQEFISLAVCILFDIRNYQHCPIGYISVFGNINFGSSQTWPTQGCNFSLSLEKLFFMFQTL